MNQRTGDIQRTPDGSAIQQTKYTVVTTHNKSGLVKETGYRGEEFPYFYDLLTVQFKIQQIARQLAPKKTTRVDVDSEDE